MAIDRETLKKRLIEAKGNDSQDEVASKLDMSQGNVSKMLSGNQQPTLETIFLFAKAYNVSVDWLLGISDDNSVSKSNETTYAGVTEALLDLIEHGSEYESHGDGDIHIVIKDPLAKRLLKKGMALKSADWEAYSIWRKKKIQLFNDCPLLSFWSWASTKTHYLNYEFYDENRWLEVYEEARANDDIPF